MDKNQERKKAYKQKRKAKLKEQQRIRRQEQRENKHSAVKKLIPAVIAIVLILIVGSLTFGKQLLDKYSYSKEYYDLGTYFETASDEDVAIIMDNKFMSERAYLIDGVYYADMDTVLNYLDDRFYYDRSENALICTLPGEMYIAHEGDASLYITDNEFLSGAGNTETLQYVPFIIKNDTPLIALSYAQRFSGFDYSAYNDPNRITVTTVWDEINTALVKKNSAVRHRGGVKSEILKDVNEGEKLIVLEQMDDWAKVATDDGLIGYIENRHLDSIKPELPVPENEYTGPVYTSLTRNHKIVMGWHVVAGAGGNDTFSEVTANVKGMNVISPTWFKLYGNTGGFDSFADTGYVNRAHEMGLEVWALIENIEHADVIDMSELLSSYRARQSLIANIMEELDAYDIDGINIDFEMLPSSSGRDFSEFIRELSIMCRQRGKVLSIDNYVPVGGTGYYDRKTQGEVADYVVIMGYDEHYAGSSEAGSVASINYVETGISMTAEEVAPEKIINAVPYYTRIWETEGTDVSSQAVDMATAAEWVKNHSLTPEWDEVTCQNYASYTEGSRTFECWLEDIDSIKVKLNIMNNYNVGGFACWRLGFETPDIWDVVSEEFPAE